MILIFIFSLFITGTQAVNKISNFLPETKTSAEWSQMIKKTVALSTDLNKKQECFSFCQQEYLECNLFVQENGKCHLGNIHGGFTFLTDPGTLPQTVYIDKFGRNVLQNNKRFILKRPANV